MKKIFYLLLFASIIAGCKYDQSGYAFIREYDAGSYLSAKGTAAYISGAADTVIRIGDNFATVHEKINYTNNLEDSILIYGHCWSTSPNAKVTDDSSVKFIADGNGDNIPDHFILNDSLSAGKIVESNLNNLIPETKYYVRSFVITGNFDAGVTYVDTFFNQAELVFTTEVTNDKWEEQTPAQQFRGGISFVYKNELYAGLGHTEFGTEKQIRKYNPETNQWTDFVTTPIGLSDAWCFVIENVTINNITRDYLYLGGGYTSISNPVNQGTTWRLDLTTVGAPFEELDLGSQILAGGSLPKSNAIAFTIDGYGYVGLGTNNGVIQGDLIRLVPAQVDNEHPKGTWERMTSFPASSRTGACVFVIENSAFMFGGQDNNGDYPNSLWMYRPDAGKGNWIEKTPCPGGGRTEGVGLTIESSGYIGTGFDGTKYLKDFWRYNPYLNTWDKKSDFSGTERSEAIAGGFQTASGAFRGFVGAGGSGSIATNDNQYFPDFWRYTP